MTKEEHLAWRRAYNKKKAEAFRAAKLEEEEKYLAAGFTKKGKPIKPIKVKKETNKVSARIASNMRRRVNQALNTQGTQKNNNTMKYVGCSKEELTKHLESLFKEGMSWDNYGLKGWHIDHIIPLCSYDLTIEDNRFIAFNYKNLQPLWAKDNLKKGGVIHMC